MREQIEKILRKYPNGVKARTIARETGLDKHDVNVYLYHNSRYVINDAFLWTITKADLKVNTSARDSYANNNHAQPERYRVSPQRSRYDSYKTCFLGQTKQRGGRDYGSSNTRVTTYYGLKNTCVYCHGYAAFGTSCDRCRDLYRKKRHG